MISINMSIECFVKMLRFYPEKITTKITKKRENRTDDRPSKKVESNGPTSDYFQKNV